MVVAVPVRQPSWLAADYVSPRGLQNIIKKIRIGERESQSHLASERGVATWRLETPSFHPEDQCLIHDYTPPPLWENNRV